LICNNVYVTAMTATARALALRWKHAERHERMLQVVQPALVGLIDGTISTLAPIFAAAYISGSRAALLVGLATALGAGISMGLSEGLSDDGSISGRGKAAVRGIITGVATFIGGAGHSLPFLISNVHTALAVAYAVVAFELLAIAEVRFRFLNVSRSRSLIQVTLGGAIVAGVGYLIGHA
jgi:erythrin-vacuolar iron transport family protein